MHIYLLHLKQHLNFYQNPQKGHKLLQNSHIHERIIVCWTDWRLILLISLKIVSYYQKLAVTIKINCPNFVHLKFVGMTSIQCRAWWRNMILDILTCTKAQIARHSSLSSRKPLTNFKIVMILPFLQRKLNILLIGSLTILKSVCVWDKSSNVYLNY